MPKSKGVFPQIPASAIVTPDQALEAMRTGGITVGVDIASDGSETHVEGYRDPATGVTTITDYYLVPAKSRNSDLE